jgi:segregation and condensation protein A
MTLDDAIARVSRMIGMAIDWMDIGHFLPDSDDPAFRRSALASSFVAALELARRGRLDISQDAPFATLKLRAA